MLLTGALAYLLIGLIFGWIASRSGQLSNDVYLIGVLLWPLSIFFAVKSALRARKR